MRPTSRRVFLTSIAAASGASGLLGQTLPGGSRPPSPRRLRFAVASDGHFGQPETDFPRFHREVVSWLNDESLGKGLDFVVFNGDLIHDDPALLPEVKRAYSGLTVPYFACRGNHDMVTAQDWRTTWGYEENLAFDHREFGFLLASTSNPEGKYLCADAEWLSDRIRGFQDKKWVFVFMHISQSGITRHGVSCDDVVAVIGRTANLAAVFHGHDHDQDNLIHHRGIPFLFDGHFGGSWGTPYRGYRIVEVDNEGKVVTYQCNPAAFTVNSTSLG